MRSSTTSIFPPIVSSTYKAKQALNLSEIKAKFIESYRKELNQTKFANNATGEKQKEASERCHIGLALLKALENFAGIEVTCFGREISSYPDLKLGQAVSRLQFIIINYQNHRYLVDLGSRYGLYIFTDEEEHNALGKKIIGKVNELDMAKSYCPYDFTKEIMEKAVDDAITTEGFVVLSRVGILNRAEFIQEYLNLALKCLSNELVSNNTLLFGKLFRPISCPAEAITVRGERWVTINDEKALQVKVNNDVCINNSCQVFLTNRNYKIYIPGAMELILDKENNIEIIRTPAEQPRENPSSSLANSGLKG